MVCGYSDEIGQVLALSNAVEHALGWVIRTMGSLVDSMAIGSFYEREEFITEGYYTDR